MEKSNSIKKVCGFYVSSVHLVTMLLPYLNKQIEEQIEIIPFLEFDLRKNVETILSKIVLNEKDKERILNINWKNTKIQKITNIESKEGTQCRGSASSYAGAAATLPRPSTWRESRRRLQKSRALFSPPIISTPSSRNGQSKMPVVKKKASQDIYSRAF